MGGNWRKAENNKKYLSPFIIQRRIVILMTFLLKFNFQFEWKSERMLGVQKTSSFMYNIHIFQKSWDPCHTFYYQNYKNLIFLPKPLAKFWVLMIHALMLKLHLIYKVGRVGPWNPIQHPSFWKTTFYITNFSSGCWTSIPLRIVIPDKGQFFPLHQGHKESVFPSLWVQNEW